MARNKSSKKSKASRLSVVVKNLSVATNESRQTNKRIDHTSRQHYTVEESGKLRREVAAHTAMEVDVEEVPTFDAADRGPGSAAESETCMQVDSDSVVHRHDLSSKVKKKQKRKTRVVSEP